MPVRAIKKLEGPELTWNLPLAIKDSFVTWGDNEFELLFQRHLNKEGRVIATINQQVRLSCNSEKRLQKFDLAHHPLIQRHGILRGEYLEISFVRKVKDEHGAIQQDIFPEREVTELDIEVNGPTSSVS